MANPRLISRWIGAAWCLAGWLTPPAMLPLAAQEEAAVEMPPFVVTATAGPAWRYGQIEGFEVLTQAENTNQAQEVIAGLWRGRECLLPPTWVSRFSVPMTVVLFNQPSETPTVLRGLESKQKMNELRTHWVNLIKRTASDRESFAMNLLGYPLRYSEDFRFHTFTLLQRRFPAAPAWLNEGLFGRYGLYREGWLRRPGGSHKSIPQAWWFSPDEDRKARQFHVAAGLEKNGRMPANFNEILVMIPGLEELLGGKGEALPPVTAPAPRAAAATGRREEETSVEVVASITLPTLQVSSDFHERWTSAAALFVRWGIYGRTPAEAEKFWRFAERACVEPVTEALFQECMGMSFEAARHELAHYLPQAVSEPILVPVDREPRPPKLKLRPATAAEVARVRGEWERMEARALAANFPDVAKHYREQAGRRFDTAYKNGERDPRLLASMGLLALDTGDPVRARDLLETAAAHRVAGPRIYFELARMRWLEAEARGPDGLTPGLMDGVVDLLLVGEQQAPPLAAIYGFLAAIASKTKTASPAQTGALERGLLYFPKEPVLRGQIESALKFAKQPRPVK